MTLRLGAMWLMWAASAGVAQTTYYVDGSCGDDAWSGLSPVCEAPDGPKKTIGVTTAMAGPGDTVIVAPGVYPMETNVFGISEPIRLRSSGGPLVTIIDGQGSDYGIDVSEFDGGPGVIEGFTLTRVDSYQLAPIYLYEADLMLVDCRFIDNVGVYSAVVYMDTGSTSTVTLIDCVFQGNRSIGAGGVFASIVEAVGCTFVDNQGHNGSRNVVGSYKISVAGCIFRGESPHIYGDGPVTYCNVEGGWEGGGNIDADPMFVDEAGGDLRLGPGSPCIDAGSNSAVPDWVVADIEGRARFVDDPATVDTGEGSPPVVDMGAYEFQGACYADFTGDGALDLFDFLAYVNAFNEGDMGADCTKDGVLDLFDFLCFVNSFNEGC